VLGRPAWHLDEEGYERIIVAAATQPLTDALAYVEGRSFDGGIRRADWEQRRAEKNVVPSGDTYHLHLRDRSGRKAAWELEWSLDCRFTPNVRFLEWYGNAVLLIYRDKHWNYVYRFGLDSPAEFKEIWGSPYHDYWVLDGRHLGYWNYDEYPEDTSVHRLAIPGLEELPPLSQDEAAEWELLPAKPWEE